MDKKIEFVFFDVGGVLIKDYSCSDKWQQTKGFVGVNTPELDMKFEDLWKDIEGSVCVDCDVDVLVERCRDELGLDLPKGFSLLDDFVDRFEKNESIWSIVGRVKKTTKIGLLTNMYPRMLDKIIAKGLLPNIKWDVVVDSSVVKLQKPHSGIYEKAEEMADVKASGVLFVENTKKHVDSATSLGWQTFLYDSCDYENSSMKLEKYLGKVGVI